MKIMSVDFGDARTGLAICDPTEFLASPVGIIKEKNFLKAAEQIAQAAQEQRAQMLVVGLPRNMDGTEGARAEKCRAMGEKLEELTQLPVVMWDERRTTVSASAVLTQNGTFGKKRKEQLDAVAAVIILESYLQRRKNEAQQNQTQPERG